MSTGTGQVQRDDVADVVSEQQLVQRTVASVAHRAVGHPPASDDAVRGEPVQRACGEVRNGRRFLVAEQLAVDQARVIVDDRVEVVVAERIGAAANSSSGDRR